MLFINKVFEKWLSHHLQLVTDLNTDYNIIMQKVNMWVITVNFYNANVPGTYLVSIIRV